MDQSTIPWPFSLLPNTLDSSWFVEQFLRLSRADTPACLFVKATAFFDGRIRIHDFQGSNVVNKEEIQTKMSNLSSISWSTAR